MECKERRKWRLAVDDVFTDPIYKRFKNFCVYF
jgi:hypothetical protein